MTFTEYDYSKIERGFYKKTKNLDLLDKFRESGLKCAKVEDWTNKDAGQAAASLAQSIKRYKFNGIIAMSRGGEVFLINKEI